MLCEPVAYEIEQTRCVYTELALVTFNIGKTAEKWLLDGNYRGCGGLCRIRDVWSLVAILPRMRRGRSDPRLIPKNVQIVGSDERCIYIRATEDISQG